jgi:hypothetical protein
MQVVLGDLISAVGLLVEKALRLMLRLCAEC